MRHFFAIVCACLLVVPLPLFAVTDDFTVRTFVGQDTTPPTTPVFTSVVPVAASQIDITWGPSTDDNQLTGYLLARDGVHIATTTQTSYSDTGLTPSTTYSYTVRAYDWRSNISSSSAAVATTTLNLPPTPTPTPAPTSTSVSSGSGRLMLSRAVTVTPGTDMATIEWSTSRPSRFILRWGRTESYELGFVATERYREEHLTTIANLEPGVRYYYELVGFNTINDIPQLLSRGSFTTLEPEVVTRPPNVYGLRAVADGADVALSWQMPELPGATVRVVRNHLSYPIDSYDGMVVFQGEASSFRDRDALHTYDAQYYTVFVIDAEGRVSSGAIAWVARPGTEPGPGVPAALVPVTSASSTPPGLALPPPDIILPRLATDKIHVVQGSFLATFADENIVLDAGYSFTLSIAKEAMPQHLKSIVVSLVDPSNYRQVYAFLLRLNADETAYEATLAPVVLVGHSRLTVEVVDYTAGTIGRYSKAITFTETAPAAVVVFPDALFSLLSVLGWWGRVLVFGGVLAGFLWWWLLWWRRREER